MSRERRSPAKLVELRVFLMDRGLRGAQMTDAVVENGKDTAERLKARIKTLPKRGAVKNLIARIPGTKL